MPFRTISRLVANVRMKLPCGRQHRFRGFREPKKRQISSLFPEGVRESSGMAFSHAFDDFGCPPGFKKDAILKLASVSFAVPNFHDFRAGRGRRQRVSPLNPSYRQKLGCYPITACSPSARSAPNLKGYALCRRPPVNRKLVTGRTCNDKNTKTAVIYKPGSSILTSWRCNSERA